MLKLPGKLFQKDTTGIFIISYNLAAKKVVATLTFAVSLIMTAAFAGTMSNLALAFNASNNNQKLTQENLCLNNAF
jgi:hypothetical protein